MVSKEIVPLREGVVRRYVATVEEQSQMQALFETVRERYASAVDCDFVTSAAIFAQQLPLGIREFLVAARVKEVASAYILSAPLLVPADLGPTPARWGDESLPKPTSTFEIGLVILASVLGDVFAWRTQQEGRIVHDILPVKGLEFEQLGAGSITPLSWHTEDAFHEHRGDYVGLACLRNPDRIATTIASADFLDLTAEQKHVLRQSRFMIMPDNSHLPKHNVGVSAEQFGEIQKMFEAPKHVSLLCGDEARPYIRIDPDFMRTVDADEVAASTLTNMVDAIHAVLGDVVLEPGDFLFIDNYRCVHGRRSFQPRFDGEDRWLKRVNVTRNLRAAQVAGACDSRRVVT